MTFDTLLNDRESNRRRSSSMCLDVVPSPVNSSCREDENHDSCQSVSHTTLQNARK